MGFGRLLGMAIKAAPKIGKAFGQISDGAKKFGTIIEGGRKFGSLINSTTGGKLGASAFGKDIAALTDKAEAITAKVGSTASQGQNFVGNISSAVKNNYKTADRKTEGYV